MTTRTVDFWFEFGSTYSYPAAMRLTPLAKAAGIAVRWRPFMLGPIFRDQGWDTSPFNLYPAKGRNMWRDLERICLALNLQFIRPNPFPQNTLYAARVALIGLAESWGEDYCRAIYRAEFGEGRNVENEETIADVLQNLGQHARRAATSSIGRNKGATSRANRGSAAARHIWLTELRHCRR
jgi:2-hydroxychromene-2-carboxylate isomerase